MPTVKSKNPRIQKPKTSNKSSNETIANDIILTEQLQKHFGFNSFKEPQKEIINSLLSGKGPRCAPRGPLMRSCRSSSSGQGRPGRLAWHGFGEAVAGRRRCCHGKAPTATRSRGD